MKIALVSAFLFDDNIGGVENHIRFMVKELSKRGHEITVFKPVWQDEFEEGQAVTEGGTITYVNLGHKPYNTLRLSGGGRLGFLAGFLGKFAYNLRAARLSEAVSKAHPNIVWQHDFSSSWRATKQLSRRYPVVLTNHTGEYLMLQNQPGGHFLLAYLLKHYKAVIGPSTELTPTFHSNSYTLFNGVDTKLFYPVSNPERRVLRQSLLEREDAFTIFCPRRWAPTKGIIYLLRAVRQLPPEIAKRVHLVFAGSDYRGFPQYVAELNDLLTDMPVSFEKLGNLNIEKMVQYYQASDLVVIPSLMEAVSLSALEAMACRTPVLATDVGGMPELITDRQTGYLTTAGDSNALSESLINILESSTRFEVANNGYKLVTHSYSWEKIAEQTERVLLSAFNAKEQAGSRR